MKRIVLASGSPRRRELLSTIGLQFEVIPDNTPENMDDNLRPEDMVCGLAEFKGRNVLKNEERAKGAVVIASDTVVAVDGKIVGKPKNAEDAAEMLRSLSDNYHEVYTGVYVTDGEKEAAFYEKTRVYFRKLTEGEIDAYIRTGEPMDKAGAYGIQGIGSMFVERVEGDFFNVVGLPVQRLCTVLQGEFNIKILD